MKTPVNAPTPERRSANRTPDDADWESKVIARVNSRLQQRTYDGTAADEPTLGWESTVLDTLRRRTEQGPK